MPEAIGAQQHRERDPAAYEAADVLRHLDRHDKRVGARARAQQSQHLVDVRLAAGEDLFAQLLVLVGRRLGERGGEVVHEGLRDLSRRREQVRGKFSHRTRGGVLGEGVGLG